MSCYLNNPWAGQQFAELLCPTVLKAFEICRLLGLGLRLRTGDESLRFKLLRASWVVGLLDESRTRDPELALKPKMFTPGPHRRCCGQDQFKVQGCGSGFRSMCKHSGSSEIHNLTKTSCSTQHCFLLES